MCKLYRNTASGYGNASNTIMTQHLGILSKGFWVGEELKLVKNNYTPASEEQPHNAIFSPLVAILDIFFLQPHHFAK